MNYYSDYEEEPRDGSSESKWDPTADMNIIKSVMSAVTAIFPEKEDIGEILAVNFSKEGDGRNMSARMVISTRLMTFVWENTDSENSKNSNFTFYPSEDWKEKEASRSLSTRSAELVKLFSEGGRI